MAARDLELKQYVLAPQQPLVIAACLDRGGTSDQQLASRPDEIHVQVPVDHTTPQVVGRARPADFSIHIDPS
jgi:hypothetical protein